MMKTLITASLLAISATPAHAQITNIYPINATGSQVVPGPGAQSFARLTGHMIVSTDSSGTSLFFLATSLGLTDVTEMAIHGPASAVTTGPILEVIPFNQLTNSVTATGSLFNLPISTATRDIIETGQAYVEVRSLAFPGGAMRTAIAIENSLCEPQASVSLPCAQCPCGNSPLLEIGGGCRNSQGISARLTTSGLAAVSADSLNFGVTGATSNSVALLVSGDNLLQMNNGNCPLGSGVSGGLTDGLRCVGGQTLRHGVRATGVDGATVPGAFAGAIGILAQTGFMAGQSRAFQVFYRDVASSPCGTGLNTTNAVLLSFVL